MQVSRFVPKKPQFLIAALLVSIVTIFVAGGSVHAYIENRLGDALLGLLFAICTLGWWSHWMLFKRVHWIEVDNEGLRYSQGRNIVEIKKSEPVRLEVPRYRDAPDWGDIDFHLVSQHGSLGINGSLDDPRQLIKLIVELWDLDPLLE